MGRKPRPPKRRSSDKDLALKLQCANSLATTGYYVWINVGLSAVGVKGLSDVTDVDVLAIRHDPLFERQIVAVSCKSGEARHISPAREAFYLRGVLDYIGAGQGVALFSKKPIDPHLRDLGRQLNVLFLSGAEVEQWCASIVNGLSETGYFQRARYEELEKIWLDVAPGELAGYLGADYWFHMDFRNLQNVLGHTKKVASVLTGEQDWHGIVLLDTAAHLSLTVFDLCREIKLLGLSSIGVTTAAFLFGGVTSFKTRRDLYSKVQHLLSSTGILSGEGPGLPPLEPPYTDALAELAARFIDRPQSAVLVTQVLQDRLWRNLGATGFPPRDDKIFLAAEKLAQDLLDVLKQACHAPWVPTI